MKLTALPLVLLAAPILSAQELLPPNNLTRAANGAPVCGLGEPFHAGRRRALREELGSGVFIMRGQPDTREYLAFRQDKNFWWLTGVESANVALVMDMDAKREVLFVAKPSAWKERWEGEIWDADDEWVPGLTGFEEVRPIGDLLDVVEEMMGRRKRKLWTSMGASILLAGASDRAMPFEKAQAADPLDGRVSREQALASHLEERFKTKVKDAYPAIIALRATKTPAEIEAMTRAARSAAEAMKEAMRSCRPGLGEWEMSSLLSWIQAREGADGPAYAAIVGSGPNSLVLHYNFSGRRMLDGEVVLIDFAPEVDHYTSDVTRTFPVSGRFSEDQARIYDVVLAAQAAGIAVVKPGATIGDVEIACRDVLQEAGMSKFIRHGSCHSVGMEVHDPGLSHRTKLKPGMVFTVEPGLYDPETNIGVRIEDVVVVTEDGCDVISSAVPRERAAIEALMAEVGVLDWMDSRESGD
jgi:Xaa-Pro aminopeptidase